MIRVYAFASQLERLPDLAGVGGAPLEAYALEDVSAVVSRDVGPSDGDPRDDAVAHGLIVEALMLLARAVLPVRFGELLTDDSALIRELHGRLAAIHGALERVSGCVEIGVRIAAPVPRRPAVVAPTGTGYMHERLARLAERDAITHELHECLEDLSRACVDVSRDVFEAAYLVERSRLDAVQAAVRRFAESHREFTVVSTGPWAPYSFGGDAS